MKTYKVKQLEWQGRYTKNAITEYTVKKHMSGTFYWDETSEDSFDTVEEAKRDVQRDWNTKVRSVLEED